MTDKDTVHRDMANAIRALAIDAVQQAASGYPDITVNEIKRFRQLGSRTARHPEYGHAAGIETAECWQIALKSHTDAAYRHAVMGPDGTVRVACEAAGGFGWERWLGTRGAFVGMKGFGASAKASDLYKHFGISAEAIAAEARRLAE